MRTDDADERLVLAFSDLPNLGITYSRAHIYRLVKANRFPQPVRLGPNRTLFRRRDIVDFINNLEEGVATAVKDRGKKRRARAA
jgi:hypothetical protein